jgi:hypothetical protein
LLVTNGTLIVSNSAGSVTINGGNVAFSGMLTGNGSGLTGISGGGAGATSANFNFGYDTTTQTAAGANTFQDVTLNNAASVNSGWFFISGQFLAPTTGLYYVSYTAETETPSGTGSSVTFQVLKNGTPITGAGLTTTFPGTGVISESQSFMVNVTVGDILEFQFKGDSTDVRLASVNGAPSFTENFIKLQ